MNYQYLNRNANAITFEDPSNPTSTLEQRRKLTKPIIDGHTVPYVRSELIISRGLDPRASDTIKDGSVIEAINKLQLVAQVGKTDTSLAEFKKQWATLKKIVDDNIDLLFSGRSFSDNVVLEIDPT